MKKSKAICLFLCLSLLASLLIPGTLAMPAKAAEGDTDNGMKVNKTAVANGDDTYTITLEAYATGSKVITEVTEDVPTDIVLVLDCSGSMSDSMTSTGSYSEYRNYNNNRLYSQRFNGGNDNLYYPVVDGYVEVSVDRQQVYVYTELSSSASNSTCQRLSNQLYIKDTNGNYQKVTVNESFDFSLFEYTYTYSAKVNGTQQIIETSTGRSSVPDFGEYGPLYRASTDYEYTYYYQLEGQNRVTIEVSTGGNQVPNKTYYQLGTTTTTRLAALKTAVKNFANSVDAKAKGEDTKYGTGDDVNHRIAVVSFTDYATNLTNGLVDMNVANGLTSVTSAVDSLQANGNTYPATGINEANQIFLNNPVESGKRNRVIVLFTDGYPAPARTDNINYNLCDAAISSAYTSKNTYGATVYTVGIFNGANPNSDIDSNYTRGSTNAAKQLVAANRYMHYTSSNYPTAKSMDDGGSKTKDGYYLSAADADTLNNIFQKISEQIESGGSSTTLGIETVIKDIVAPAFDMPTDTSDIKVYTAESNGSTSNWKNRVEFTGTVTPDTENSTISVSGFSFKDNWCGKETTNGNESFHDGKKLIIEFTVTPKAGFLGGNNVYTNTSAGVYVDSSAAQPVKEFPRPQVNVPIKDVTVTAQDKNVYLLGNLTADQIKTGATVECGNVKLNLNESNYGLADWQTKYVDITVEIKDKDGKAIPADGLNDLREDTTYTITATVKPKAGKTGEGASGTVNDMDGKSGKVTKNILVFKPELTFQDSEVYYGDNAPTDFSANKTPEVWKHGEILSTDNGVNMIGTAPTLVISYTPENGKIVDGKISTKQDIAVDATVKIGTTDVTSYTTFQHMNCEGKTCTVPNGKEFLLHVKTCQLTITKTGGADSEPYVFTVKKGDAKYSEVTINGNGSVTIYELPVGTYSIEEDTGWSWRYTGDNGSNAILSAQNYTGFITCTNSNPKPYWLNGYSAVKKNVYGTANN